MLRSAEGTAAVPSKRTGGVDVSRLALGAVHRVRRRVGRIAGRPLRGAWARSDAGRGHSDGTYEMLALETETRLPKIEDDLDRLPVLVVQGIPVLLTGDFNSPSFHDGVCCRTIASDSIAFPVEWPVS